MKSVKFLALTSVALVGILPLAGCGNGISSRTLTGGWDCVDDGDGYPYPVDFYSDGSLSLNGDPGIWRLIDSRTLEIGPAGDTRIVTITSPNRNELTVQDQYGASYCTRR